MFFATPLALLIAAGILFWGNLQATQITMLLTSWGGAIPLALLAIQFAVMALAFHPLQKAAETFSAKIINLYRDDPYIKAAYGLTIFLVLFSLALLYTPGLFSAISENVRFALWLLGTALSADLTYHLINRTFGYIDPLFVTQRFALAARHCIDKDRERDFCEWVDALFESGVKSIQTFNTAATQSIINAMGDLLRLFFEDSKSIAHEVHDPQSQALGVTDKVSFTLLYFLERFELLFKKALSSHSELICSTIITTLGKIMWHAARCDVSLISHPAYLIGKLTRLGQELFPQIGIKGSCTLLETTKMIANEIDLTYMELQEPLLTVLTQLDDIAKESFKQNKNLPPNLLMEPISSLKGILQSGKLKTHRDTPGLLQATDSIIAEWETLATVLRTMPTIPVNPAEPKAQKEEG
jgi:hypothetical protein